ncbi:PucR family transcriptional regulator [Cryobacterium psychrophilum]|uniref:PucR family transcriptional regulator n=1 Tax=Cryobacterium psychrophilum TaxID=41988 RepID=A0A4Y8KQZ8_9MICO|nr:helix-turn-helix domain-containing protein [Cryobacterium psychrophilum]TDW29565.1 PucR-like helix-turn-helix protein [Cryobacterium psychrophilum]TFD81699.1 PucR family transcriptional regulator [Cryobacterium psychrophilum]
MNYQKVREPATVSLPLLAEVCRSFGPDILSLVEDPAEERTPVAGCVLYDRFAPPTPFPGAIALAVGLDLADDQLPERLRDLAAAGYLGLVYKQHGRPDAGLRSMARSNGVALLRASDAVPWDQLTEILTAAIIPHGASVRTLVDILPGDLFALANTVASLTGGAVAIADPEQTVLAYSTLPGQPIDDTRRNSILQLHVPHSEQNDLDYRRVHAARDVVSVAPGAQSLTRSAAAIRAGSVVLGSLWVIDADNDHDPQTARLLLEAANVAALHLLHRRTHSASGRDRQISLVRPLLFEPDRAELSATQLGIAAESVRIVALTAGGPTGSAPAALQASLLVFDTVRTACAVWLPTAVCGLADNVVYIVLPQSATASFAFQREAILRITHHARRLHGRPILAGFGRTTPIGAVPESRADAEVVLAALLRDVEEGRLRVDSDDIVADQQSLGPRLQLRQICADLRAAGHLPGADATRISDHDSRKKTAFAETIRTYLDCDANAIETARRLGLHANTVRYRLSRVESLFGVRLDDPDSRLLLWLQLWAQGN